MSSMASATPSRQGGGVGGFLRRIVWGSARDRRRRIGESPVTPYLFILSHFAISSVMILFPFFLGIWISLHDSTALRDGPFIGLRRYQQLYDPSSFQFGRFWNAVWNTIIAESERVQQTVAALEQGRLEVVGAPWAASHRSLRELYEVTSPELDALVEIAFDTPGVVAARMTGAGFGGCTVNLVERDAVAEFGERVASGYAARFGREAGFHPVEPAVGAGLVAA